MTRLQSIYVYIVTTRRFVSALEEPTNRDATAVIFTAVVDCCVCRRRSRVAYVKARLLDQASALGNLRKPHSIA